MKEIKAVIQPLRLARVRDAFRNWADFPGMTVIRVDGCSKAEPSGAAAGIKGELTEYSPQVRIEIVAPDEIADEVVRRIRDAAHTGQKGDGLVWVVPVDRLVRVRERG